MTAALWLALSAMAMAMAQGGGYPASPSHAVTGATPDGAPRYGREPRKAEGASPETAGRGSAGRFGDHGKQDRAPNANDSSTSKNTGAAHDD